MAYHNLYVVWVSVKSTVNHLVLFKIKIKCLRDLFTMSGVFAGWSKRKQQQTSPIWSSTTAKLNYTDNQINNKTSKTNDDGRNYFDEGLKLIESTRRTLSIKICYSSFICLLIWSFKIIVLKTCLTRILFNQAVDL